MFGDIVKSCYEKAQEQQKAEGYINPLPGIDVPFALSLG
jgi:fatty acid synthase subunit alpha